MDIKSRYSIIWLAILGVLACCGDESTKESNQGQTGRKNNSALTPELIRKIGGNGSSSFGPVFIGYDMSKPIDIKRPVMPQKTPGLLLDGIYRLKSTNYEGAEKVLRGPMKEKYRDLLFRPSNKLHGVLQVSNLGTNLVEWRFGKKRDGLLMRKFLAKPDGSLEAENVENCEFAYFTDGSKSLMRHEKGDIKLIEYCKAQSNDEYAKNGIPDHHELWEYTYEPYPLNN